MNSLIPPVERLIVEYKKLALEYDCLQSKFHLDDWASEKEAAECSQIGDELEKLTKVLDALSPGWDKK